MYRQMDNITIEANVGASVATCGLDYAKCSWSGDLWTDDAVAYIQNTRNQRTVDAPFYLFLSYTAPHAGSVGSVAENDVPAPRVHTGPYANQTSWPSVERDFATAVYDVDDAIGQVLRAIDNMRLANNTVVFFSR